jgi:serine/threonine-protein kinase HipA
VALGRRIVIAEVRLWGRRIGAVSWRADLDCAAFQYEPAFVRSGIEVAPLTLPLADPVYLFPELPRRSFHGLPGLLADSLPDRFGNALIDQWLATQGRTPESFGAIERLCYLGARGMGALEFAPMAGPRARKSHPIRIDALVQLASDILADRQGMHGSFASPARQRTLQDILQVGTSAGGARAKAVIAWNPTTNEVRSGQVPADPGFSHWLLKFDGVAGNRDRELEDPRGFGAVEYAYALMAQAAGIRMSECRLLEENGRRHFMTRRFDRGDDGSKRHMQSLAALAHFDYNHAGAYSYEQALQVMRRLDLPMASVEEQFRRMLFNIVARNQDDHVKNIAFLMDKTGTWSLAPAFDLTYSYNPSGAWTAQHQMTVNGRRDGFSLEDLRAVARVAGLRRGAEQGMLEQVTAAVRRWADFAERAGVGADWIAPIGAQHRTVLPPK